MVFHHPLYAYGTAQVTMKQARRHPIFASHESDRRPSVVAAVAVCRYPTPFAKDIHNGNGGKSYSLGSVEEIKQSIQAKGPVRCSHRSGERRDKQYAQKAKGRCGSNEITG